MALRIKYRLTERTDLYFSPNSRRLTFAALADESIPADDRVTQSASFTVACDNPAALEQLTLGGEYYFDISPAVPE